VVLSEELSILASCFGDNNDKFSLKRLEEEYSPTSRRKSVVV